MTEKFKETEIGLIPEDWEVKVFSDIINVNPKRTIKRGEKIRFVSMGDLNEFNKKIGGYSYRKYSGGSRFINGDTLMARITPSLENGKTSFVDILNENEIGAGSTEFIVLSSKEGKTIPSYVYYLAISPEVRKEAINSMTGTSGRQRVENDVFNQIEIPLPPISEQRIIANFLCAIDEKIELNQKMNQNLEKIGQSIFKHWFIDFEFPDEDGMPYKSSGGEMVDSELGEVPEGWEVGTLKDICEITMGQSPKSEFYNEAGEGLPFHQGVTNFGERFPKDKMYCTVENKIAGKGDILFSVRAPVGRINIANSKMVIGRGLCAIRHKNNLQSFILYQLKNIFNEEDSIGSGTVFNAITRKDLDDLLVLIPNIDISTKFNSLIGSIDKEIENLTLQNDNLSKIRDSLLPKLMSGKIRLNQPKES